MNINSRPKLMKSISEAYSDNLYATQPDQAALKGKVKKIVYIWCRGTLLANELSIYYIKCLFCPQNLMLEPTGKPGQNENFMKNIIIFIKCFRICRESGKRFLQLRGRHSDIEVKQ